MLIQELADKMQATVENHALPEKGFYARYLRQAPDGSRRMGKNEYGCADAANIRYILGSLRSEPELRAAEIAALQSFQHEDGLFAEPTHHTYHCTAHCTSALELYDARPLLPLKGLDPYRTAEGMAKLLDGLRWKDSPWNAAHQGAGVYAALVLTGHTDPEWQKAYFDWLDREADPTYGFGRKNSFGADPLSHHLFGWFHYQFNYCFARRPLPYADKVVDTCLELFRSRAMDADLFGRRIGFCEIDWIYALNRCSIQSGHRLGEARESMRKMAGEYVDFLMSVDPEESDDWNDLHMLFGAACAVAELQQALPGEFVTKYPLRLVLDRRPFI